MIQGHYFTAILLLGGIGSRFSATKPKQFHLLSGKKIYLHSLDHLLAVQGLDEILLVVHSDYIEEVKNDLVDYPSHIRIVVGGTTRQASSYRGLLNCKGETDYVLIHDAVRPFVSKRILEENLTQVLLHGAVDTCLSSADTIVESLDGQSIHRIPPRSAYLRGQTPQTFRYDLILRAHQNALERSLPDVSDDCRLVLERGHPVFIVAGEEVNIKITTELDLFLAEQLMRLNLRSLEEKSGSLTGKKYIVVGGSRGIGRAIVDGLESEGASAISLSRSSFPHHVDIRDEQRVKKVFNEIYTQIGPVDGLINSAGLLKLKAFHELSCEEIEELLKVNLHGVLYSCRWCRIHPGGHVVNMASSSFTKGRKHYALYSCAKAAVVNFTQALSEERPDLCINVIVPQRTRTKMRQDNFPWEDEKMLLDPKDVAKTVISLLKQQEMTGQIIEVRKGIEK